GRSDRQRRRDLPRRPHAVRRRQALRLRTRGPALRDRGDDRAEAPHLQPATSVSLSVDRLRGPLVALLSLAAGAGIWQYLGTTIPKTEHVAIAGAARRRGGVRRKAWTRGMSSSGLIFAVFTLSVVAGWRGGVCAYESRLL